MNCKKCKSWENYYEQVGLCKINSPCVIKFTITDGPKTEYIYGWPDTDAADWCDKFKEIQLGDE